MSLNKLLLAVIAAAAFTNGLYLLPNLGKPQNPAVLGAQNQVFSITLKVTSAPNSTLTTTYQAHSGDTVLTALNRSHSITTKTYSFGTSVESINGLKGDTDGKYWLYYVNNQEASVGADRYALKSGDVIEWKFETSK